MSTLEARNEDTPTYSVGAGTFADAVAAQFSMAAQIFADEQTVVDRAISIIESRLRKPGQLVDAPRAMKDLAVLKSALLGHEEFGVFYLDGQHRLISFETMFRGSLTQTSVYPREVAKRALALNAGAVVLTHNHPSGMPDPSRADEHLTSTLKTALALVDVRVLDHIVVGGTSTVSFAERGLI